MPGDHNARPYDRRTIRLPGYDYRSTGAYFVTICTVDRTHLFGVIADDEMHRNALGVMAAECWQNIPVHFPHVTIDAFVVMPNHVHGIIIINEHNPVGARHASPLPPPNTLSAPDASPLPPPNIPSAPDASPLPPPNTLSAPDASPLPSSLPPNSPKPPRSSPSGSLGAIIGSYKSAVTRQINARRGTPGTPVWQRNYYEHIIRDDDDYMRSVAYIVDNPRRWFEDRENPANR